VDGLTTLSIEIDGTFDGWRRAARKLLSAHQPPAAVRFHTDADSQPHLGFDFNAAPPTAAAPAPSIPRGFIDLARGASHHRDPERWALLYRVAFRLTHGERNLLDDDLDHDVNRLRTMRRQVSRDIHKMHAFVRFREVTDQHGPRYVAWHRPDHFITRLAAPFFVERFRVMRWSILTPDESAHWDGAALTFGAGCPQSSAPTEDRLEDLWRTYYASMFNPARANERAMVRELPRRHWATLPEAQIIPSLLATAPERVGGMIAHPAAAESARPFIPDAQHLSALKSAADGCRGCDLFKTANQVVFGEGPATAKIMLVGEQPGDEEDLSGVPFVGPAGRVLDDAIAAAGLARRELYVTNAVKHFTFRREGKRRLHEKPRFRDVRACRPWLEAEIERINPAVIVCMGATAAQSLLGPAVRIGRDRGRVSSTAWAPNMIVTYHPSAVLRADDPAHAEEIRQWLIEDLALSRTLAGLLQDASQAEK
jgi:uracil-DNA glycosylase